MTVLCNKVGIKATWLTITVLLKIRMQIVAHEKEKESNKVYLCLSNYNNGNIKEDIEYLKQELENLPLMFKKCKCSITLNNDTIDQLIIEATKWLDQSTEDKCIFPILPHYVRIYNMQKSPEYYGYFQNIVVQYSHFLHNLLHSFILDPIFIDENDLIYYQIIAPITFRLFGLKFSCDLKHSNWDCLNCGNKTNLIYKDVYCRNKYNGKCDGNIGINPYYFCILNQKTPWHVFCADITYSSNCPKPGMDIDVPIQLWLQLSTLPKHTDDECHTLCHINNGNKYYYIVATVMRPPSQISFTSHNIYYKKLTFLHFGKNTKKL